MKIKSIPGLPEDSNQKLFDLLHSIPEKPHFILFGSRAKGNFREGSDIDIAIKSEGFTVEDRSKLLLQYDDLYLPWKLDIVVYSDISEPALKEHIDRVGLELENE